MPKIITLVAASKSEDMHIPPLALLYVGGALKKAGYEVNVLHLNGEDNPKKNAVKILKTNPFFIGFSSITGPQIKQSAEISKELKKLTSISIVWGGVHASLLSQQVISEDYVDYVVIGEGEETFVELTQALEGKIPIEKVRGIAYKKNNKIITNPERPLIKDLDKYKLDFSLIDVEKHLDSQWGSKRILAFITSRGCIFNCAFCYNLRFNKRRWRYHSTKKVINEINELKDHYNLDGIRFYDDFFFANPNRALEILEAIKLPWYGEMKINLLNQNLIQRMIKTQPKELLFGLESGSDRILSLLNKRQTVDQIKKGVELLKQLKDTKVVGSFIIGLPTETQQEVFKTIDLALELYEINPNMQYAFGVYLPYPGTDLYELTIKKGFSPPKKTEDWANVDSWYDNFNIDWLDWTNDASYFLRIRNYMCLMPLKKLNIPILRDIPEKRLRQKDFSHKFEILLLDSIRLKFATKKTLTRKILTTTLPYLTKNKINY